MKAVRIHQFGGAKELHYEDVDKPEPKPDEVLVRVKAAGVGGWEIDIRKGGWQGYIDYDLPLIIGTDMAGIVEAVGSKVKDFHVGDEVYGVADMTSSGSYAQYAVAKHDAIAKKPKSLTFVQAASVPVSAVTAWLMLHDLGKLRRKQKVLIHGAAGAVGAYAVQLAKLKGARVIATASKGDRHFLESIGVDRFVDYHTQNFEDFVDEVDLVVDLVGGETRARSIEVVKEGGALITAPEPLSKNDRTKAKKRHVKTKFVECVPTKILLKKIARLIDSGKLKTNVGDVLSLSRAAEAQKRLEHHKTKRGKVVLRVA
jgi:NADPH:quinone reductase-like Zn-dependent oxidoreductase